MFEDKNFPKTQDLFSKYNINGYFEHRDKCIEEELNNIRKYISGVFLFTSTYTKLGEYKLVIIHKK